MNGTVTATACYFNKRSNTDG